MGETGGVRDVVILGSTGSVGTQALDVIARHPDRFRVVGLAAGGERVDLLARQALEFRVEAVAVARASAASDLQLAFYAAAQARGFSTGDAVIPKILAGPDAAAELAAWPCDVVLNAMTGAIGLAPTLAALDAGRTLALANKESLIVGGALVMDRAAPGQVVPVDSEHCAIAPASMVPARVVLTPTLSAGWCSPPAAVPSAGALALSLPGLPPPRHWHTPPG